MAEQGPKLMEAARFVVIGTGGRWKVRTGPDSYGPYLSRRDAFLDAVDAAHAAAESGSAAEVADVTATGGQRVLWNSERDAYPPEEGAESPPE
jgi:hypothetical protein